MGILNWKNIFLIGLFLLVSSIGWARQEIREEQNDYILFISSINFQQKWTKNLYWHLYTHLQEQDIPIHTESLSIPTLKNKAEAEKRLIQLSKTYATPPKAVFFDGELSWIVCRSLFDTSWKEVPAIVGSSKEYVPASLEVLFSQAALTAENTVPAEEWKKGYNVTTLKRPFFIKETIELMHQLIPEMNKVVLISDDIQTSSLVRMQTEQTLAEHYPEIELEHLMSVSNEEMVNKLRRYDKQTGIIYHSWLEKQPIQQEQHLVDHMREIVSTFTCTPVFLLVDHGMETNWFAGGHFIPIEAFGEKLIETLQFILSGTPARDIPTVQGGMDSTFLSYTHLINNGIIPALHPRGEIKYFNAPLRFYEQYKLQILLTICILCIVLLIIGFYIYLLKQEKRQQIHENLFLKQKEQLKEFYESVLNNLPLAVTINKVNEDLKPVFWNKKACDWAGCQKDSMEEEYLSCKSRKFAKKIRKIDQKVIEQKEIFSEIVEFPGTHDTLYFQISKVLVPYKDNESRLVSLYVDITDLFKNKQRLEVLNKKHELTLKTAKVTSWVYDTQTNLVEFSENDFYSAEDAERLIHPEDLARLKEKYAALIEGVVPETHNEYRTRLPGEYSEYRWVFTSSVIGKFTKENKPATIISASTDIHLRKLLELELRQMREKADHANRLKSSFITHISQEVRTPLNAITGFSELLAETDDEKEKQTYLKLINSSNETLLKLINEMLDLTLIEAGRVEFSFITIPANEILEEATTPTVLEGLSPEVSLKIEKPSENLLLSTDKVRVSQVLTNFMTNAIRHTQKGEIRIGYRQLEDQTFYFYVKDTGNGILPEKQKILFENPYALDSMTQGHGLGLTNCQMIIKRLGGNLGVHSEPGKGSEFWFTLPPIANPI